ncbi:MAG: acyl-ACP--UDP-N-acetylglucosamine O-acyltransferase [Zetaproteobacteria bacterium]|nr:acyl-ACP--UDP-N-acetylglucosamine O-acyltransferase [Zetaproteobacteria bacterium]
MSRIIHPTAIVADSVELADDVEIGAYCVLEGNVKIASGTRLMSHVSIAGNTTIGHDNRFFPYSSVSHEPQDLKFHGEPSQVVIGDRNTIREHATIHPGTEGGGMMTRIGNDNLLMAYTHIAHDCLLGNQIVMANAATLAGHVSIDDGAIIGGMSAIHQFLRIGRYSMVGGMSGVVKDIPPYCLTAGGYRSGLAGLNLVGLKRRGFTSKDVRLLKEIYRVLFQNSDPIEQRLAEADVLAEDDGHALHLIQFVRDATRGLTMHRRDQS